MTKINQDDFIRYYKVKEPLYPIEARMLGPRMLFPGFKDEELILVCKKRKFTVESYRENNDNQLIEILVDPLNMPESEFTLKDDIFENMK